MSSSRAPDHPIPTPRALSANTGPIASAAWLVARGLAPDDQKWHVDITLGPAAGAPAERHEDRDTRFDLEIYAEEWGFKFSHGGRVSWIRVTDVPFVHGRDEHQLLRRTPPLKNIGTLVAELEQRYEIRFDRRSATIRTTIADAASIVASWIETL